MLPNADAIVIADFIPTTDPDETDDGAVEVILIELPTISFPEILPTTVRAVVTFPVNAKFPAMLALPVTTNNPVVFKLPALTFPVMLAVVLLTIVFAIKFPANGILSGRLIIIVPVCVIGLFTIVNVLLDISTLVTVPRLSVDDAIVILPLLLLTLIPCPALILVTPVLVIVIVPLDVTGPPVTAIPGPPAVTATLVTVPTVVVPTIVLILPNWSTVNVGAMYSPGLNPGVEISGNSMLIMPELTTGVFVIRNVDDDIPTLVTPAPPVDPVAEIVILPVVLDNVTPVPAVILVTPVLVKVIVLLVVSSTVNPDVPKKLVYGLAYAKRFAKLFCVLVKATNRLSLPVA